MPRKVVRSPRLLRREQKRKTRKTVLFLLLTLMALGAAAYGFSRPQFRIDRIDISGSARVPAEEVTAAVREVLEGTYFSILPKSHALLYPKTAIKETLARRFPVFLNVSVSLRSLAAMRIAVREREPYALWCAAPEECYLLDETGFAFAAVEQNSDSRYYRFEEGTTTPPVGRVVITKDRLILLVGFLEGLGKLGLDPKSVYLRKGETEVSMRNGVRLIFSETEAEQALQRLSTLLAQENLFPKQNSLTGINYIDLRYGNKIYFKPH